MLKWRRQYTALLDCTRLSKSGVPSPKGLQLDVDDVPGALAPGRRSHRRAHQRPLRIGKSPGRVPAVGKPVTLIFPCQRLELRRPLARGQVLSELGIEGDDLRLHPDH